MALGVSPPIPQDALPVTARLRQHRPSRASAHHLRRAAGGRSLSRQRRRPGVADPRGGVVPDEPQGGSFPTTAGRIVVAGSAPGTVVAASDWIRTLGWHAGKSGFDRRVGPVHTSKSACEHPAWMIVCEALTRCSDALGSHGFAHQGFATDREPCSHMRSTARRGRARALHLRICAHVG